MGKRAEQRRFWAGVVAEQAQSGLTQRAFCDEHGLDRRTFVRWRSRFRHEVRAGHTADFVEIVWAGPASGTTLPRERPPTETLPPEHPTVPELTLHVGEGSVLRLPAGFDAGAVADLVAALRRPARC